MHHLDGSSLEPGALIFLAPLNDIAAPGGCGSVGFTLQVAINVVRRDRETTAVLEGLQAASDRIPFRRQAASVFIE
jgi:hypothetical protein